MLIGTKKWLNIESIHKHYTTNELLKMCHHEYDSQKNESLNTNVATYAPKNKTFCTTKSLEDRICLVVIFDSIGYSKGVHRIISKMTGHKTDLPLVVAQWLTIQDQAAERTKNYRQKISTKKR